MLVNLMLKGMASNDSRIFMRFFLTASLVIGLCISAIFLGLAMRSKALIVDQAIVQARAHFEGIVLTRKWNAQHGGVYVIKRPGMQSNPYLRNPDFVGSDGRVLTLKNPALMTREVSELTDEHSMFTFHITSLRPINPGNVADSFEMSALREFETGTKEFYVMEDKPQDARLRYMAPLMVEQSCLACHGEQGYKLGDVRGGISVSFSIDEINKALHRNNMAIAGLSVVTVGLLLATLWYYFRQMQSRLDESQEILRRMATTDALTNVANRASLMKRFNESFARQRRKVSQVGCLMIDVDHFKTINDRFGHLQGDAVLRALAGIVSTSLREYDAFGRYGGEEFLLVLEGVDAGLLARLAERTRTDVEANLGQRSGLQEAVTISLGATLVVPEDESIDDVIRRADEALYMAKSQGRNRVVLLEADGLPGGQA